MSSSFLTADNITYLINTVRGDVSDQINYDITNEKKYVNILKKLVKTIHNANLNKPTSKEAMNNLVVTKCVPFLIKQINKTQPNNQMVTNDSIIGNLPLTTGSRPTATRTNDYAQEQKIPQMTDFSNLQLGSQGIQTNQQSYPQQNMRMDIKSEPTNRGPPAPISTSITQQPKPETPNFSELPFDNQQSNMIQPVQNMAGVNTKDIDDNIDFAKKLEEMQREREYANNNQAKDQFQNRQNQLDSQNNSALSNKQDEDNQTQSEFFKKLERENQQPVQTQARDQELENMNLSKLNSNYMDSDVSLDGRLGTSSMLIDDSTYEQYSANSLQLGDNNSSTAENLVSNFRNSIENTSRKVEFDDTNQRELIRKEKDATKDYMEQTLLSTNYSFERSKRRILSLDISDGLQSFTDGTKAIDNLSNNYWGKFRVNLQEEFIIDKINDIFVESIIINNPAQASPTSNLYMVLDIDEFNIKTMSNNTFMSDKFVLPNENTTASGTSKIMKYHLKSNYVATINPTKLTALTFNITNEDGYSVESSYTDSSVNVGTTTYSLGKVSAESDITTTTQNGDGVFAILDAVYNSSKEFVGNIFATTSNSNTAIKLTKANLTPLFSHESLFFPASRTAFTFAPGGTNVYSDGDTTLTVSADPSASFRTGSKVYLGTGILVGTIDSINTGTPSITFEKAIKTVIPNGARLYDANPLPRVFGSNNKSNRIILELVFISR